MKLLIISHTEHFRTDSGIVGFAPTLREIDHLATLFDEVVHIATLRGEAAPRVAAPYRANNVRLRLLPARGGDTWFRKLGNLVALPRYLWAILAELSKADAVHVRCPAFVSLLALICLSARKRPRRRWLKYAGNWKPEAREPLSYRIQHWLLNQGWAGGGVTVNGRWPDLPPHVSTFVNPCLTDAELNAGREAAALKRLSPLTRLLFVGRLEAEKGALCCLDVADALRARGHQVQLDLVGDGTRRSECEARIASSNTGAMTLLHGWLGREALNSLYGEAHFVLLPSASEGWLKVLSEGMASGAVPIAAAVGSIPGELQRLRCGATVPGQSPEGYVSTIEGYLRDAERWQRESVAAQAAAGQFGYRTHIENVARVLEIQTPLSADCPTPLEEAVLN